MQTVFDWLSVGLFCAIAVVFLQRSTGPARKGDTILLYLPPVLLCALANWAGNSGHSWIAAALLTGAIAYFALVLRPWRRDDKIG